MFHFGARAVIKVCSFSAVAFRSLSSTSASEMSKTKVYFDITIGGKSAGRITFEVRLNFHCMPYISSHNSLLYALHMSLQLRGDVVPKTAGMAMYVNVNA